MVREIDETPLPGVGVRYSFETTKGLRLSVLHHRTGHRELFAEAPDDPDAGFRVADLDEGDSQTLAELLGGSKVRTDLGHLQQAVAGLTLDWVDVEVDSPGAGRTIGQLNVRSTTGVTIVTVVRGREQIPVPGPDFALAAGDTVVVLAEEDDLRRVHDLVRG